MSCSPTSSLGLLDTLGITTIQADQCSLTCRGFYLAVQGGDRCGKSTNFWEYYEDDIARAVSLNSTCFRLSLGEPLGLHEPAALMSCREKQDTDVRSSCRRGASG